MVSLLSLLSSSKAILVCSLKKKIHFVGLALFPAPNCAPGDKYPDSNGSDLRLNQGQYIGGRKVVTRSALASLELYCHDIDYN